MLTGSVPEPIRPHDEIILQIQSRYDGTELFSKELAEMDKLVVPDFELPEPGEGVQNNSSDYILREFTNERLFNELKEGKLTPILISGRIYIYRG